MMDCSRHARRFTPMPVLRHPHTHSPELMEEVLRAPQPVVTVGVKMQTAGWESDFHTHQKAQLMLSLSGVATCEAEGGLWLVPPQSALFVPGVTMHRVAVSGNIEGYAVFIGTAEARMLPAQCASLTVTPLLRELIVRSAQLTVDSPQDVMEPHLNALLLHEIARAPAGGIHLPMPTEPRLRTIFTSMMENPAHRGTIESWARHAGLSQRTLARVVAAETGMSFGRWRQQLNLILAMQWMAAGASVQQVALDLGYESAGSFVTMFRKALGTSPARYMSNQSDEL